MTAIDTGAETARTEASGEIPRPLQTDGLGFTEIARLFIRAWPFIRPVRGHVLGYMLIEVASFAWGTLTGIVIFGTIYNSLLLSGPVTPFVAGVLRLDPGTWVQVAQLTAAQRTLLIGGIILMGVVGTAVGQMIGHANAFYRIWIEQQINQALRLHVMRTWRALSLRFHGQSNAGEAVFRVLQDSAMVTGILKSLVLDPALAGISLLLGLAILAALSPGLALVAALVSVPLVLLVRWSAPALRRGFGSARAANAALTDFVQESMEGVRTLKVERLEADRLAGFQAHSAAALAAAGSARTRLMFTNFAGFFIGAAPLVALELYAAFQAHLQGPTFLHQVLAGFGFAVWNLGAQDQARTRSRAAVAGASGLAGLWNAAQDMAVALARVYQILDLVPDIRDRPGAVPFQGPAPTLRLEGVGFGYPGRQVLSGVDFEVRKGEITALLGPTGSGKSTLALLMLRLLDPDQGRITLDGQDLRGFTVESVRRATSLGTQENSLFSGTIADNIRIGRPGASDAEVAEAARVACLDSLVSALPEGFQTPVGGRALELSTGQRQRLVIARALLKATPILVLDEPTASLDPATERTLVDNLKAWAKDRTVVIITHRMSTAACADQVVILDAGRVVESGRPDDLAWAGGTYSRLLSSAGRESAA